mgnify:CR=1 FL=1
MKIDKKMALISAVLLTVSPVLTSVVQPTVMTVQAATKNKNTQKLMPFFYRFS